MTDAYYLNDTELAQELKIGGEKLSLLRAEPGFPPKDQITGKRYWPAIKAWLDHRHGLDATMPEFPDGEENWDRPARRR